MEQEDGPERRTSIIETLGCDRLTATCTAQTDDCRRSARPLPTTMPTTPVMTLPMTSTMLILICTATTTTITTMMLATNRITTTQWSYRMHTTSLA
mmetsp:Transcript_134618/g.348782  ORF Transcript_134618/g.348782 Transcript_134618/m.348782 type:complete len:96 (+) Transcript_134618:1570-1857(+)